MKLLPKVIEPPLAKNMADYLSDLVGRMDDVELLDRRYRTEYDDSSWVVVGKWVLAEHDEEAMKFTSAAKAEQWAYRAAGLRRGLFTGLRLRRYHLRQ